MSETVVDSDIRCAGCGHQLRPNALFCTACGTRRPTSGDPIEATCGACGSPLGDDATICTDCGVTRPVGDDAGETADAPRGGRDHRNRVGPAASREILGSVSRGMGPSVGVRTDPRVRASQFDASTGQKSGLPEDLRRRRGLVIAVTASVALVLTGLVALVATQSSGKQSLQAGGSIQRSEQKASRKNSTTGSDVTSTTVVVTTTLEPSSDAGSPSHAPPSSAAPTNPGGVADPTPEVVTPDPGVPVAPQPGGGQVHSSPGPATVAPRPQVTAPPATRPPFSRLQGPSNIGVGAGGSVSLTLTNTGTAATGWQVDPRQPHGVVTGGGALQFSPGSGSLGPGASVTITVTATGSQAPGNGSYFTIVYDGGAIMVRVN